MHADSDRTAANFAILNRGKRAGRSVDNRGEDRSAVGANNARLYFKVHRGIYHKGGADHRFFERDPN